MDAPVASQGAHRQDSARKAAEQGDLETLRQLGLDEGFPASLRLRIYQLLLDCDLGQTSHDAKEAAEEQETAHPDEQQVLLDTHRSFTSCLPSTVTDAHLPAMRNELQLLIGRVLRRHPWLHYYQGFHDIAQQMLLVANRKQTLALALLEQLALYNLRDFMRSTLAPSMTMLALVHDIVRVYDPDLCTLLEEVEPFYAVSPLLTLFLHNLTSYDDACRVMDVLVASNDPAMILYLIAAQTILRKQQLKEADGDPDLLFHILSKSRHTEDSSTAVWLRLAVQLHNGIRPRQLRNWSRISKHSVLKTAHLQTAAAAEAAAAAHESELAQAEQARRRRQAGGWTGFWARAAEDRRLGVAVTVGLLAVGVTYYLQHVGP